MITKKSLESISENANYFTKVSNLSQIQGGTSTTEMAEVGRSAARVVPEKCTETEHWKGNDKDTFTIEVPCP